MASEEPLELRVTSETIPEEKIGKMTSEPPDIAEVGGRDMEMRLVRCGSCEKIGYVHYYRGRYRGYFCNYCGAILVFD